MSSVWTAVCRFDDIYPDTGVCALVNAQQVAVFRVAGGVYAIGNHDPVSKTNVLSRGIVGDIAGELVVASPIYKQHFSLITGRCLEEATVSVPVYAARIDGDQVFVKITSSAVRHNDRKQRLVVIGNGLAGMRALEELIELNGRPYDVVVFGSEPVDTYNRVLLSALLSREKKPEDIVSHAAAWFTEHGITLHLGDPILKIDRAARRVHSSRGINVEYDRLLIGTGSTPVILAVPGKDLPGVMTFRDLADVDAMQRAAKAQRQAVVVGGGLLGLEAASGLAKLGMAVTVVHSSEHLMNRQLDAHASELLRKELEDRGLQFQMSARTQAILGDASVTGVQLLGGTVLAADLVVMAIGVQPNIALAKAAGLRCDRGILVDDTMQTFDPAIYAVGDCIQHRDNTYGLVAPGWEQARVCAAYLGERGVRRYRGSQCATQLKVAGIHVYSAGEYHEGIGRELLEMRDPKRGVYKRIVIANERICGAVLYGDTKDGGWYSELINEGRNIGALRSQLMFGAPQASAR